MQTKASVDWTRYLNPTILVLTAVIVAIVWNRLFYGIGWTTEGMILTDSLWSSQYRNIWGSDEGLFLFMRRAVLGISLFGVGAIAVFLWRIGFGLWGLLFSAILLTMNPIGVVGPHPLVLGGLSWSVLFFAGWSWFKRPRIWLSWFLPWCALLVWLSLPQMLPGLFCGLIFCLARRAQSEDSRFLRLHLLAQLNLVFFVLVLAVLDQGGGVWETLRVPYEKIWSGWGATSPLFEVPWAMVVAMVGLFVGFLFPSRVFHPAFAGLTLVLAVILGLSSPVAAGIFTVGSGVVLFLLPSTLAQLDRQSRSPGREPHLRVGVFLCGLGALCLLPFWGPSGAVVGALPLLILLMVSGYQRNLFLKLLLSSFLLAFVSAVGLYWSYPEQQPPRESLDQIESGAFRGIWTTRPEFILFQDLEKDLNDAPGGADSLWVSGERVGAYWLASQEKSEFAEMNLSDPDVLREALRDEDIIPDLILEFPRDEESPVGQVLSSSSVYRVWKEREGYRIFAKRVLIEGAMNSRN